MKYTKFIYIVLLSMLSFFRGTETQQQQVHLNNCITLDSVAADDIIFYSSDFSSNNLEVHYKVKKKTKCRATTLEQSTTIKIPYFSNLVNFKLYKKSLIYGIASIYQIQRHTYLHLYQLF
ncbi:hypothetical protein B4N84_18715 [Flavobacterium sp. IR1]|nr:hypothetical protein B4N84_18715 [Flavobacterium sp. IR1]